MVFHTVASPYPSGRIARRSAVLKRATNQVVKDQVEITSYCCCCYQRGESNRDKSLCVNTSGCAIDFDNQYGVCLHIDKPDSWPSIRLTPFFRVYLGFYPCLGRTGIPVPGGCRHKPVGSRAPAKNSRTRDKGPMWFQSIQQTIPYHNGKFLTAYSRQMRQHADQKVDMS